MKTQNKIKIGTQIFHHGLNGNPPALWEFTAVVNGVCRMEQVKPRAQTTALSDQFITFGQLEKFAKKEMASAE